MIVIGMIRKPEITTCWHCERTLDLTGGGPYYFDAKPKGVYAVCPECAAGQEPLLGITGALFGAAASDYNQEHPEDADHYALTTTQAAEESDGVDGRADRNEFRIEMSQRVNQSPCALCSKSVPAPELRLEGVGFPELTRNGRVVCPDCGIEHAKVLSFLVVNFFQGMKANIQEQTDRHEGVEA